MMDQVLIFKVILMHVVSIKLWVVCMLVKKNLGVFRGGISQCLSWTWRTKVP